MTRRLLIAIGAAAALTLGVTLLVVHFASIAPDPDEADAGELIDYVVSERFNELPVDQRQAYIEAIARRYASMDESERQRIDDLVKRKHDEDADDFREQTMKLWKDMIVSAAESYVQLPPDEREVWLRGKMKYWEMLAKTFGDGPDSDRAKERRQRQRERREEPLTAERQEKVVTFFKDQIMPQTTAKERALVMTVIRDAAKIKQADGDL